MLPRSLAPLLVAATLACGAVSGLATRAQAVAPEPAPVVTQLIVRIDPAETTIAAVVGAAGTPIAAESVSGNGSFLLDLPAGVTADAALATISALPGIDFVVPNTSLTPPEVDQSRIYAWRIYAWATGSALPAESQYAATSVNLAAASGASTGRGVVVAVLDTGVQLDHPALRDRLVPGYDFVDGDAVPAETLNGIDDDGDGSIDEGAGHGTHVAGIVHTVAPGASIMPVRVLDDDGTGTLWSATEGMYWAASHGAKVLNMSLGTHGSARPLRDAVTALAERGVLVVAAAGNEGKDRPMFPAAAPEAIAVGSVGAGDVVSSFSNIGRWIDVMAPGENIHSTYAFPAGSYAMNSGTSMASPWVAGEAALLVAKRPALPLSGLVSAIKTGAAPIDASNPGVAGLTGAGRIDIAASLGKV